MNQRERYLAMAVGAVLALLVINILFKNVLGNLRSKEDRVDTAFADLESLNNSIRLGNLAAEKISKLRTKSLPDDQEAAAAQYKDWLYELANQTGMSHVKIASAGSKRIIPRNQPMGAAEAFNQYEFSLSGQCSLEKMIELMGNFYDRNYLHRISSLKFKPTRESNLIKVDLTSEVISLPRAGAKHKPALQPSGRLAMSIQDYQKNILQRNPFASLNEAPRFQTSASHSLTIGQNWQLSLDAADPEGHSVTYELVTGTDQLPEGFTFDNGQLSWQPKEKGETRVTVRATDDGWPRQHSELTLTLNPVIAVQPVAPTTVDPAQQAFLTGLVTGRSGVQGWIRSRVDGTSIDIFEGADIKIGTINAKVVSINIKGDFVELETDGVRWKVDMNTSLADAYQKRQLD